MGNLFSMIQIAAMLLTVMGIYLLSRKEQNKLSMYLMLSTIGCLIVNCSYFLLMHSTVPEEGILAMRMESIGNTLFYYFLHYFIIEYLKLKKAKVFLPIWAAVEFLTFYCFLSDKTISYVYKSLSFIYDERMGVTRIVREMGILQIVRNGLVAFIMASTLLYMLFRLFFGRLKVKFEKRNLARLIGADFVIVTIMTLTMFMRQSFNITPLCTTFAIFMIILGVAMGEMLNAVDTGRQWVVENMDSAFVVVDSAYGYLDANASAKKMFPRLATLTRNGRIDCVLSGIFRTEDDKINLGNRCYEKSIQVVKQNDEIVGYTLMLKDVTEQQLLMDEVHRARQRAEDANEAKSAFMSNMSHEIRTPMNAIVGMTDILLRSPMPEQERGYLQNIRNSGSALLTIINDILDFSKIESKRMEIVEEDYDPMSLLHDMSMIFLNRIGEKPIELLYDIDVRLPARLRGDALRIRQVIINLMNNAIKFTEDGYVKLSLAVTELTDEQVALKVSVEDSGQGIREEDISKLFGTYQQVDTKKNHAKEGTGLGLAISRNLVELMGGEFIVESEYGVGSCFSFTLTQKVRSGENAACPREDITNREVAVGGCFSSAYLTEALQKLASLYGLTYIPEDELEQTRLDYFFTDKCSLVSESLREHLMKNNTVRTLLQNPMMSCEPEAEALVITKPLYTFNFCRILNGESGELFSREEESFDFTAPKATILVVDDNEMNLKVAAGLLAPFGMTIDTADNGKNALAKITRKHYDLIFMDHMMPVMDGIEATRALRGMEDEYCRTVPVIALTANVINEAKEQFKAAGMNDFASKPIKLKEIVAVLRRWLPQEYIEYGGDAVTSAEPALPEDLPVIEGLDCQEGILNSGSSKLFFSLLADFYHLIDMKSEKIEKCLADGLLRDYTIEVHALKNTARLIGALELSAEFLELEKLGNAEDSAALQEKTPAVLAHYRSYKPVLKPYAQTAQQEKTKVDAQEIIAVLQCLAGAIDSFDLDGADEAMHLLETYALPGELDDSMERLRAFVADVAMEDVMKLTEDMVDFLKKQGE